LRRLRAHETFTLPRACNGGKPVERGNWGGEEEKGRKRKAPPPPSDAGLIRQKKSSSKDVPMSRGEIGKTKELLRRESKDNERIRRKRRIWPMRLLRKKKLKRT